MLKAKFFLNAMLSFAIALPVFADDGVGNGEVSKGQNGERLMEKSGCLSCHRVDQKLIGPPFKAVAERYRKNSDAPVLLFNKVREGGEGVWDDIPMVPNGPNKIADADLHKVIDWILGL